MEELCTRLGALGVETWAFILCLRKNWVERCQRHLSKSWGFPELWASFQRVNLQKFAFEEVGLWQESVLGYLGGSSTSCPGCTSNPGVRLHGSPRWLRGALLSWCGCSRIISALLSLGPCPGTGTFPCHRNSWTTPRACRQAISFDPESAIAILCKMILGLQGHWAKEYWAGIHEANSVPRRLI